QGLTTRPDTRAPITDPGSAAGFHAATAGIPEEPIGGAEFHIAGRAARIVRRKLPRRARVRATLSNTYWL
ncbi:hypothetical protein, partial [Nocardia farcinica]|uniref:hypothetical protein n=1 Tax=Nocardia farcinica TaxID=37329 RepID=UPI002453FF4E